MQTAAEAVFATSRAAFVWHVSLMLIAACSSDASSMNASRLFARRIEFAAVRTGKRS
jgi:hypothetical protein